MELPDDVFAAVVHSLGRFLPGLSVDVICDEQRGQRVAWNLADDREDLRAELVEPCELLVDLIAYLRGRSRPDTAASLVQLINALLQLSRLSQLVFR